MISIRNYVFTILCTIALVILGVRVADDGQGVEVVPLSEFGLSVPSHATHTPTPTPMPTNMPTPTLTFEEKYTFQELNRTMYASTAVNVRSLPTTDGKILGTLQEEEAIRVTGKCNEVSWYRVEYNGKTAYVYAKYLMDSLPTPTPTPPVSYANSLWVDEEETIYVLDSYDTKIVKVEEGGYTNIDLPGSVFPADVLLYEGKFYIYDEQLNELRIYSTKGELLKYVSVPSGDDFVKGFQAKDGVALVTFGGKRLVFHEENDTFSEEMYQAETVYSEGYHFCEYLGTDASGIRYSVNTTLVENVSVLAGEITVCASTPDGEFVGGYILPTLEYTYLPDHYVRFTEKGDVYVLITQEDGFAVEKVTLTANPKSQLSEIKKKVNSTEANYNWSTSYRINNKTAYTDAIELTREEAYERAVVMAEYRWTLTQNNVKQSRAPKARLPRYIAAIAEEMAGETSWEVEMTGIPYCWGGFVSPYRNAKNQFETLITDSNFFAGNINSEGDYQLKTAGLDCSGYVSTVYGISKKLSTGGLSDIGRKITDVKQLERMDMLVAPGDHIVLFCGWIDDGTIMVTESAVRDGKVIIHPKRLNSFLIEGTYQMRSPW